MTDNIAIEQLRDIRESGVTNMMDRTRIMQIAHDNEMHELVVELEMNPYDGYVELLQQI